MLRVLLLVTLALTPFATPARASGATWTVDRASDLVADGSLADRRGSLRFVLAHAIAGDTVRFGDIGADSIFVGSTLNVPAGVAVGRTRTEPCGEADRPLTNLLALPSLSGPIITLGAGATLRNLALANAATSGATLAVAVLGGDTDLCAVTFGAAYDPEGAPIEVAAPNAALSIDGPKARVHRSRIKGAITISPRGDASVIGDALGESGEANLPLARATVTVGADGGDAARQVTIRDALPRLLQGLIGSGVPGGDDLPTHANHWALTPTITGATSADNFATVRLCGIASPLAVVDIFIDDGGVTTRAGTTTAGADGRFGYLGPLPGAGATIRAAATLNDPAVPARVGSSSQFSAAVGVQAGPAPACDAPLPEPRLEAVATVRNLSNPAAPGAQAGDTLRATITISNPGAINVQQIASQALQVSPAAFPIPNTASIVGGTGFFVQNLGFEGGVLAPGETAVFTVDLMTTAPIATGAVVLSGYVVAERVVNIPVVGRLSGAVAGAPAPRVWLPLLSSVGLPAPSTHAPAP